MPVAADYVLIAIEDTMMRDSSSRMRELRAALLFALCLACVCFGGAVAASTFITH
jgi:hypothetical protein